MGYPMYTKRTIVWRDLTGDQSVTVEGFGGPGEIFKAAARLAYATGYTQPKWWQWWRWGEDRVEPQSYVEKRPTSTLA
jgi:hypothetical protein